MSRPRRLLLGAVLASTLAPTALALAAAATLPDLEDEVMCVVCQRPLATSGGTAADDERKVILTLIDQGLTKQQIKDKLVDEYGQQVLVKDSSPVAAAAPIVAALVGAASIGALLLRRRGRGREPGDATGEPSAAAAPPGGPLTAADDARIDAELAERR